MSRELITALDNFIQNFYHGGSLSEAEARETIEEGLLELVWKNGKHAANGLLVTESGYFITSDHCVDQEHLSQLQVRDHRNKRYEIEKVLVRGKGDLDIALVKAEMPFIDIARRYRFRNSVDKIDNIPVALLTRRNGEIVRKYGLIPSFRDHSSHFYHTNINCVPGDSGGIILTPTFQPIGILRGTNNSHTYNSKAVDFFKALELIHFYKSRLESRL